MRRVILESPYKGNDWERARNEEYARRCLRDSLNRGEAPFASHLLYTQVLCDDVFAERDQGIEAGLEWGSVAEATVVYRDYGISPGMWRGIERAKEEGRSVYVREIGKNVGDLEELGDESDATDPTLSCRPRFKITDLDFSALGDLGNAKFMDLKR